MDGIILIAVNGDDIASVNQAKYLLGKGNWIQLEDVEGHAAYLFGRTLMVPARKNLT
jgi:hypothetical protein